MKREEYSEQCFRREVYWKKQPAVPLPEEVVKRLDGQAIAVVGFELNQVRRTPDGDIPVPHAFLHTIRRVRFSQRCVCRMRYVHV